MTSADTSQSSAAANARSFSAGVTRTLARGTPSLTAATGQMATTYYLAPGQIAPPPTDQPVMQLSNVSGPNGGTALASASQTAAQPAPHLDSPRRSQSQLAALFARMIAQGQRNL
jgi:hypothetical protein